MTEREMIDDVVDAEEEGGTYVRSFPEKVVDVVVAEVGILAVVVEQYEKLPKLFCC